MLRLLFLFLAAATAASAAPFKVQEISDEESGLKATVFTFSPKQNKDFALLDLPDKSTATAIKGQFDPAVHELMINGGYFNADWSPTGYCKVDGKVISSKVNQKLSGFICIDKAGKMHLLTKDDDFKKYPTVLQSGPHVIDPGGKIGIRTKTGRAARRTLVGRTKSGDLVIVITRPIYLIDLAGSIQKHIPDIERLLNLDGGPSTGYATGEDGLANLTAVRNYLVRKKSK